MIILSASGISLSFGEDTVLSSVTFSVGEGDRVGVVGVNGSGKSTLFKIISGELDSDAGEVFISKGKTVGILHQNDAFKINENGDDSVIGQMLAAFPNLLRLEDELTDIERQMAESDPDTAARLGGRYAEKSRVFSELGGLEFRSRCRSILLKTGFDESMFAMSVSLLSGGQRTRLALARLLASSPDILLLDEPTNHLDTATLEWLEEFLGSYRNTVMVISHDRYFLDKVTNKTLELEYSGAKLYGGNYTAYTEKKAADLESARHAYNVQQKEIARLEAYIEQQRRWNRERNIIAAESREKAIERMEKVEKPKEAPKAMKFSINSSGVSGNDVLSLRRLGMRFGDKVLFENADLEVKRGDKLFFVGPNGCGKSTLLKIILSQLTPTSGESELGYNVTIGYYDQENQNLDPSNTVLDELWNEYPDRTQTEIRNTLARFLFKGDDIERKVGVLSGGERARLTLSKLMLSKMNLLVLDEPTNHLDIPSREALEAALTEFDGTIIAVSHDRYFIDRLASKIADFDHGSLKLYPVRRKGEAYTEFTEEKTRLSLLSSPSESYEKPTSAPKSSKEEYLAAKAAQADAKKEERRRKKMREELAALEEELVKVEEELNGPAGYDYVLAAELDARKTEIEERLLVLYGEDL
ncbi:MAG: ABC-F family ATP-binding cassette domain-containing protein [Clostridia bacterium]|nr:ABC-F family ATP-binding cassette domain-containing protein [Clostridia bacterium]